jgi:hypothetical protein
MHQYGLSGAKVSSSNLAGSFELDTRAKAIAETEIAAERQVVLIFQSKGCQDGECNEGED